MVGSPDHERRPGETAAELDDAPPPAHAPSLGLVNAITLVLMGVLLGVFWREVFQLTIRMIERLGGG